MKRILIYTTDRCPYCFRAKRLLDQKGLEYQELRVDRDPKLALEAEEMSGGRKTVPQIFIDDYHVGGCDELYGLEGEKKLDQLLEE